ncbi:MAG: helix-turn-helix domain-containing protein, partial [Acidimicrobiales bacterium]
MVGNANSGRYPKLSAEERKRIIGLVADGMKPAVVAREVARSTSLVQRTIREAGGVARRLEWDPSPSRLSAADREEIRSGLDAGESFAAIGRRLGRATST